jgi:tetratricopeptide (TPR) repeat protein
MNAPAVLLALLSFQAPTPPAPQAPQAPQAETAADLAPGVQLFEAGRFEEARAFFEPYVVAHASSAAAAFYLGRIQLELKKPEEAVRWLERAVEHDRDNSDLHRWLARAYGVAATQANQVAQVSYARQAKEELDKAVRLDPKNLRAREDLVNYYLHSPAFLGGSVERARHEAEEMRKIDPVAGRMMLANVHFQQKEPARAEKEYQAAIQEVPKDLRPRMALGYLYQSQKRWDEAFDAFEGVVKIDPESWNALYQIGRTAAFSGQRLDRAKECLERYLTHAPTGDEPPLSGAHFRLGMIYEKKGDAARAREEYRKSLELDPSNAEVREALQRVS